MANRSYGTALSKESVFLSSLQLQQTPLDYIQVILISIFLFLKLKSQYRGKKARDAADETCQQETDSQRNCVSMDALPVRHRLNMHETLILRLFDEQS